jgi:hypothetical protein
MKLKKGSAAAKAFMAKLRAAKGKPKLKVSAKLKSHTLGAVKKTTPKKKAVAKSYHKDTKSHNVNVRVVSGLDKVTHKGKKTNVHYSRMSGTKLMHKYTITLSTNDYDYVYGFANTLTEANKIFKTACLVKAKDILRTGAELVVVDIYDNDKQSTRKEKVLINKN